LSHGAQLDMKHYAPGAGGVLKVLRRGPRDIKINHAQDQAKPSDP